MHLHAQVVYAQNTVVDLGLSTVHPFTVYLVVAFISNPLRIGKLTFLSATNHLGCNKHNPMSVT